MTSRKRSRRLASTNQTRFGPNTAREANKDNIGVRARRGIASGFLAKASACRTRTDAQRARNGFMRTVLRLRKGRSEGCQKLEK
jgi:hypothetical protein